MAVPKHSLAASVAVVNSENKILLVRNRQRGWEFPGGYVEEGESIQAAAIREVKEESGIDIRLAHFCGIAQDIDNSSCTVLFLGAPVSGELQASDDTSDAGYFTVDEALRKVRWKTYKERILKCLNKAEQPFLIQFHSREAE